MISMLLFESQLIQLYNGSTCFTVTEGEGWPQLENVCHIWTISLFKCICVSCTFNSWELEWKLQRGSLCGSQLCVKQIRSSSLWLHNLYFALVLCEEKVSASLECIHIDHMWLKAVLPRPQSYTCTAYKFWGDGSDEELYIQILWSWLHCAFVMSLLMSYSTERLLVERWDDVL